MRHQDLTMTSRSKRSKRARPVTRLSAGKCLGEGLGEVLVVTIPPSELVRVLVVTMTPHKTTHHPAMGEARTDPWKSLWCFFWHRARPHKTPRKTFAKTSRRAFSLCRFRRCQKVASAQDSWPRLPSQDHRIRLPTKTFTKPPQSWWSPRLYLCHQGSVFIKYRT